MRKPKPKEPTTYVPVTPGGSYLFHLEASTEQGAIDKLLQDAAHMPYKGWEGFKERGYSISCSDNWERI